MLLLLQAEVNIHATKPSLNIPSQPHLSAINAASEGSKLSATVLSSPQSRPQCFPVQIWASLWRQRLILTHRSPCSLWYILTNAYKTMIPHVLMLNCPQLIDDVPTLFYPRWHVKDPMGQTPKLLYTVSRCHIALHRHSPASQPTIRPAGIKVKRNKNHSSHSTSATNNWETGHKRLSLQTRNK